MLGTEPEIVESFVGTGQVKIVFWPVLNHGNASLYATLAAECIGRQSSDAFWEAHELLYVNQSELWGADRDYYVDVANRVGVDGATFEACYDGEAALSQVMALDELRRERGVFSQPIFDINGQLVGGAQPFSAFAEIIQATLP